MKMFTMILEEDYEELDEVQLITINGGTCTKSTPVTTTQGGDNPPPPPPTPPTGGGNGGSGGGGTTTTSGTCTAIIPPANPPDNKNNGNAEPIPQSDDGSEVSSDLLIDDENQLPEDVRIPDKIDRTNHPYIRNFFTNKGFRLLSGKKDYNRYPADGTERKYYQSIIDMLKDNGSNLVVQEMTLEGVPNIDNGGVTEDFTIYKVLTTTGKTDFIGIDINNDGEIDYVQ